MSYSVLNRIRQCSIGLIGPIILPLISVWSCSGQKDCVRIEYCTLRDRVIVTDHVFMKKAMFVGVSVDLDYFNRKKASIQSRVFFGDEDLGSASLVDIKTKYGNLVFDLPYELPQGDCKVLLSITKDDNEVLFSKLFSYKISDLAPYNNRMEDMSVQFLEVEQVKEDDKFVPSQTEVKRGYEIFQRSPLTYVYSYTRPERKELIESLNLRMAGNDYELLTFSIYPLRDLGNVSVSMSDLRGNSYSIPKECVEIFHIGEVQSTIGLPEGTYQNLPTLLIPGFKASIKKDKCKRFWMTIRAKDNIPPGMYRGEVEIIPEVGEKTILPISVEIVPITLEDVPGIDYFMLMTYEFVEMSMPWNEETKAQIYDAGVKVLKDYKEHGMTTLCMHSPFVLIRNEDGSPNLDDIFSGLVAARDTGFSRSVMYYIGHLINTAKDIHPANIGSFDQGADISTLKEIVRKIDDFSGSYGCPSVVYIPIDEPNDTHGDPRRERSKITPLLLKAIRDDGGKVGITTTLWQEDADVILLRNYEETEVSKIKSEGQRCWIYNNDVTLKSQDPTFARFVYGVSAWCIGVDGIGSWTFQTTQNARGDPRIADSPYDDIYLAYPDPEGPIATIKWESIREGIEDYKLIYQLEKRIQTLSRIGRDASEYREYLRKLKQEKTWRVLKYDDYDELAPGILSKIREDLMNYIIAADSRLRLEHDDNNEVNG